MKFYFAPMEGITGYVYRNAYEAVFSGISKYFSPFIVPHQNRDFKQKELRDIFPENNSTLTLIPQILTNQAEDFLRAVHTFQEMGYEEVNLNLGCPSGTVTAKGKGAGFLAEPEALDGFLETIYEKADVKISIKTRIGIDTGEEFCRLLEIYQKYPIEELIVHPRCLKDYYKKPPDQEIFLWAARHYNGKLIYNGDIFCKEDYQILTERNAHLDGVMLGRGLLRNPGLIQEILEDVPATVEQIKNLHDHILEGYMEMLSGDRNVLFRMKELWFYMIEWFAIEGRDKYAKQIKKAQTIAEYRSVVDRIFQQYPMH
jgi:dihydrouridine synthase, duS